MRKLCIAIPTFNRCIELDRALNDLFSIIQVSKKSNEIEILISDNGSNDETVNISKTFTKKFESIGIPLRLISNSTNIGFDKNLLNCFLYCEAEYVWFLSDDDVIRSEAVEIILSDIDCFKPNCILYNFNQKPYNFGTPYITENKYFSYVNEESLDAIIKILQWPKMSSIVMKGQRSLNVDFHKLDYKFMHVGLFCQIALSRGRILHSKKFIAGADDKYLEKIDFMPFVANYMNETIYEIFVKSGRIELQSIYADRFPPHYVTPFNACLQFVTHNNRYGVPIKKELKKEINNLIFLDLKKNKIKDYSLKELFLILKYFISYIEKILKLHKPRKCISEIKKIKNLSFDIHIVLKKIISRLLKPDFMFSKRTYSQYGEDLIIEQALNRLNISSSNCYYLDIGSNHPYYLSNTYYFYKKGSRGVCIEPDISLVPNFRKKRKEDKCISAGVSIDRSSFSDFYLMTANVLNTFSYIEAEKISAMGTYKIKDSRRVQMVSINEIFHKHLEKPVDFVSLDVEGLDLNILETLDFNRFRPPIFCIETLAYSENSIQEKNSEVMEFMKAKNYIVFADTYVNTIFVDSMLKEFN